MQWKDHFVHLCTVLYTDTYSTITACWREYRWEYNDVCPQICQIHFWTQSSNLKNPSVLKHAILDLQFAVFLEILVSIICCFVLVLPPFLPLPFIYWTVVITNYHFSHFHPSDTSPSHWARLDKRLSRGLPASQGKPTTTVKPPFLHQYVFKPL